MKILVIMGSPRKGNTYQAASIIEDAMKQEGDVEFEYLMLKDADIAHCRGCFLCFSKGEEHCPNKDDAQAIEKKMHEADGVIFATPVYGMNVSGLLKIFIDRFSYIFHRPRFFDKYALLLTTAGAVGTKDVLRYLDMVAMVWGFEVVSKVGLITPPMNFQKSLRGRNKRELKEAAKVFYTAITVGKRRSPRFMEVMTFHFQRGSFDELREDSPVDYEYWKESGWLERGCKYFVDVPVNPFFHFTGLIGEWFIRGQVRKTRREQ